MKESKDCATLHHVGWSGDHDNIEIVDLVLNGRRIATMKAGPGNLIVRAVNAHDALVAACEAVLANITNGGTANAYPRFKVDRWDEIQKLTSALALAKGENP